MTKWFLGAVALGVGLTLVPVTVRSSDHATTPTFAVSEACAQGRDCCRSLGDLCLHGETILVDYRPAGVIGCSKPGT
jgi:hypothetical protein